MKRIMLGKGCIEVPSVAVGCMRITNLDEKELISHLNYCMENGLNFFDHADIYGGGECEIRFSQAVKKAGIKREDMIIQSKCGIVPNVMYDFSKEHIITSVDGILKRLDTDYIDILLLHRPDPLVEPSEVAEAFNYLARTGKVRYFGVSNHRPGQIELLKKYVVQPLIINQLQLSIPSSNMISSGMEVNMMTDGSIDRDGGVLDYCRLNDITIQAWSPFQYGFFNGTFVGNNQKYAKLNETLNALSEKYCTTPTAIVAAWIVRHPANIQIVAGTTNTDRMSQIASGCNIVLERKEWYKLYLDAGHILP